MKKQATDAVLAYARWQAAPDLLGYPEYDQFVNAMDKLAARLGYDSLDLHKKMLAERVSAGLPTSE